MKFKASFAFQELSGSAKSVTAVKNGNSQYLRSRGTGNSVGSTAAQSKNRIIIRQLSQNWKKLTEAQRNAWNQRALEQSNSNQGYILTGENLYVQQNYWVVYSGNRANATPPASVAMPFIKNTYIGATVAEKEFGFWLSIDNNSVTNTSDYRMVIMVSPPQSAGISDAYNKCQVLKLSATLDHLAYKSDDYFDKYGEFSLAKPKIFFRCFIVNIKTGQKSNERQFFGDYRDE